MALKVKLKQPPAFLLKLRPYTAWLMRSRVLMVLGIVLACALIAALTVTLVTYNRYQHIVDERLAHPLFLNTAKIYATPREVRPKQKLTASGVAEQLANAGYSVEGASGKPSRLGTYRLSGPDSITVTSGPESYHAEGGATISFSGGKVSNIVSDRGETLSAFELEPELITGLSEGVSRTKRRLVSYDEIPQSLVDAVVAIEDRRFFEHGGVDYWRLLGALRNDLTHKHSYTEGGSTLTMQAARGFFLSPEKRIKRKLIEILITFQLEHRFNKQQIFQIYANYVPLGQAGSFAINGFGEAARAYFGKNVKQLDLAESATLAGLIQSPSRRNPYRHPDRAVQRRNVVLDAMVDSGKISQQEADQAKAEPLKLASVGVDAGEAPYFVDLVREQLVQKLGDRDYNSSGYRIYTSLDPDLQHAATEAVAEGMKLVDERVDRMYERQLKRGENGPKPHPQVALVALNPHTGQVLALVGGRNYGLSQLNHAVAHRPTGSIFKPFVYAAAYNSSIAGVELHTPPPQEVATAEQQAGSPSADVAAAGAQPETPNDGTAPDPPEQWHGIFTAVTPLSNDLTTFEGGYSPGNFHGGHTGQVTARYALQMSLNNATVELAQMVGYDNVASLARDAGVKAARGTPSVALGSYDATPLDMAGAYTVFANGGVKIDPWMLASIRTENGNPVSSTTPNTKPLLDPRVAYLTTSLLQNVINAGTGAGVRQRGFSAPAAGKTGSSHDAWFAGYTSNLICIVWVGNDDYTDIKIQGADAAAPIWAEFMKRAIKLPQYSDTTDFTAPAGITTVRIDKDTSLLTNDSCPTGFFVSFLDGTEPMDTCDHANGDQRNVFQKIFGVGDPTPVPTVPLVPPNAPPLAQQPSKQPPPPANTQQQQVEPKKHGFFGRLFGHKNKDEKAAPPPPDTNR